MNKLLVNTPQNVQIEYNIAVFGPRLLAFVIDLVIRIAYTIFGFYILDKFEFEDYWLGASVYGLFFLPILIYGVLLESIMNGQTIGKWVMRIRVVQQDGRSASFYNYFTRWLIGLFEIHIMMGVIAFFTAIINKNGQRLGDMAANTVLISLKAQFGLSQTIFQEVEKEYVIQFPEVSKLSDHDINIVNNNFQLALKTDNFDILEALTRRLEEILEVDSNGMGFKKFISTVIEDHYHFHRNK